MVYVCTYDIFSCLNVFILADALKYIHGFMLVYFYFVNVTRVYGQVTTRCHYLKGATPRKGKQLASLHCYSQNKVIYNCFLCEFVQRNTITSKIE